MNHEKLVINEKGDKVRINVSFYESNDKAFYNISLAVCANGKRKFIFIHIDNWEYRSLSMENRRKYEYEHFLKYVTQEQINEAKLELWHKLSPQQ